MIHQTCNSIQSNLKYKEKKIKSDMTFHWRTINTIHDAAKGYLIILFEEANLCAIYTKSVTVKPEHIQHAQQRLEKFATEKKIHQD